MPGSAENPVRIGPFKRIVEVGWPARHLAFLVQIQNEESTVAATPCSPDVGSDNGDYANYMTTTSMEIFVGSVQRYSDTIGWQPVSGINVTFEGEPETPFENSFGEGEAADVYTEPHRLVLAGGGTIEGAPPVPARPDDVFTADTGIQYEVIGRPLDPGGGVCLTPLPARLYYPPTGDLGAVTPAAPLGIGSIVMTYRGRQYTPLGAFLVPNVKGANPTVEISAPISAWVLCEPIQTTA